MWGDYENETLIHNHKLSKIYKKRYQRAGDFHNTLYRLFGLITLISTTSASTILWVISDEMERQTTLLNIIITVSAISSSIQIFYKFQENANNYTHTAKAYAKLQNKIEGVGNIHPEYRKKNPEYFLREIQKRFDTISDSRMEILNCMTKYLYSKKIDGESYLEEKHKKFKFIKIEGDFKKIKEDHIYSQNETDDSDY
tara:strand:- start:2875 stop:3468 length:594 start_codon:yes stop_codon:yes gene_type:complete